MKKESMKKINVLLVEDNEADVLLTSEGLNAGKVKTHMTVMTDGWEAMQFLEKKGKYQDAETPDLVLLDINLPKMNGHEVLRGVKTNPDIRHIPVVMLTTSSFDRDIKQCYDNHANSYVAKPMDVNNFIDAITSISDFWFGVATLPNKIN